MLFVYIQAHICLQAFRLQKRIKGNNIVLYFSRLKDYKVTLKMNKDKLQALAEILVVYLVWNLTLYSLEIWLKFKLSICDLKFYNANVPLNFFWSYLNLYFYVFFNVFLEETQERDIKIEQIYIFNHVFNKVGLRNSN